MHLDQGCAANRHGRKTAVELAALISVEFDSDAEDVLGPHFAPMRKAFVLRKVVRRKTRHIR